MPEPEPEAAEPGIGACVCIRHEPTTWPIRGDLSWMGLCARQAVPAAWLSVWMAVSVSWRNLTYVLEVHQSRRIPLRRKERAVDDAREKSKRGSTTDNPISPSIYLRAFAFSHKLALTPPDPDPRPRNRTQEPGQTSQPAPEGTGLGRTGPDRAGQARPQARHRHRHNSASSDPHIASAKYRITVSHLPSTGRQSQLCEARRGEARPESEPEVSLHWELHSRLFSNLVWLGLSHIRSINPNISPPSRQPASAHSSTHLLLLSLSAPSLCSLPPSAILQTPHIPRNRLVHPDLPLVCFSSSLPLWKSRRASKVVLHCVLSSAS